MQHLRREHIDIIKWNSCIDNSPNGLLYGYSFYLDSIAKNWNALVYGDYEAVMPLTWNRKYGISYLYQPAFTQQLGVFSTRDITKDIIELFLTQLGQRFHFAEIFLNFGNPHSEFISRPNYVLPLHQNYDLLARNYTDDLQRNVNKAVQENLQYRHLDDPEMIIRLYRETYGKRFPHVGSDDYQRFEKVCREFAKRESLILRGAFNVQNELLAAALILRGKKRLHLLHSVTLPEKRKLSGTHFLLDSVIREFSGSDLVFDFEGSTLHGVAQFYKNFGATEEPYFFYRFNALPWPLRLFK